METNSIAFASASSGTGLRAEYYNNANFTNLAFVRTDPTLNFNWGTGAPATGMGVDTFSVRWTGQVEPLHSETYTFYTRSDDGVRLWVNGQQLISNWTDHAPTDNSGMITLTSGQRYNIQLDYYENIGGAVAQLSWASPSQAYQIIPQSQLYPIDISPPTANISTTNVVDSGGSTYRFIVTYADNIAVNTSTLDSSDIQVIGPNGFSQLATLLSIDNPTNGNPRVATYQLSAPDGAWNLEDNGTYTITLQANQVSDINNNAMPLTSLGTFQVNISATVPTTGVFFPSDAGVINIMSYGAIPNDGVDDTAAIQRALNENPSGNRIFYFPDGVYDVSNTLRYAGTEKRNILQGQSRDGTIIRLRDNAGLNGSVIATGSPPAQRFRNSIRNLTINTGRGNPGASGISFIANNQGTLSDVTIISQDRQGTVGLDLGIDENGPALIQNVRVAGFDIGIRTWNPTASLTLEHIQLENQNRYGWQNFNQTVFARDLQSRNEVTTIWNMPDGRNSITLLDSRFEGVGAAANLPAIHNQRGMYIRNLTTSGYNLSILQDDRGRGNPSQPSGYVGEWIARGEFATLFPSPAHSLNLEIRDTPDVPWDQLTNWVSPIAYGGLPDDGIDDTAAIQAAIDSGATTVYLPNGTWDLNGTVELRANVQRFLGTEAFIRSNGQGVLQVGAGTSPTVVIERLEGLLAGNETFRVVHDSSRTLVLANILNLGGYTNTNRGSGDLFIEDVNGDPWVFKNQNVWARQFNPERPGTRVINDGGQLWILGYKTEDEGTLVETINGGRTEVIGTYILNGSFGNIPAFISNESSLSLISAGFTTFSNGSIPIGVREIRDGVTRTWNGLPGFYSGYRGASSSQPPIAVGDSGSVIRGRSITLNILANDSDPDGFLNPGSVVVEQTPINGNVAVNSDGSITYTHNGSATATDNFTYTVVDDSGMISTAATVNLAISAPPLVFASDDFNRTTLNSRWTFVNPRNDASYRLTGTNTPDAYLELVVPGGASHDAWNTNNSVRVMQSATNEDFEAEVKFASRPSQQYQLQGILIQQNANNWLRFDTYHDGLNLRVLAATTTNGSSQPRFDIPLGTATIPFLRVRRQGNQWIFQYSTNGQSWTTAGSFSHTLVVSAIGTFAGNAGASPAFTAKVDYFFNTVYPIVPEDAIGSNLLPVAANDTATAALFQPVTINVLGNDQDPDGSLNPASVTILSPPNRGTAQTNSDGTITYSPTGSTTGTDSFTYTVADNSGAVSNPANVNVTITEQTPAFTSDDFNSSALNSRWTFINPRNDGSYRLTGTNTTNAFLELVVPGGTSHDAWNTNNSVRVMQAATNQDFETEVKFASTPSQQYQLQGILVEQNASNWLRFDTYHNGSELRIFAATTTNGSSQARFDFGVTANAAYYLRARRQGNLWTFQYSADGQNWTTAVSFSHTLLVGSVGTFAGNAGSSPAFTAKVDYFFNTTAPIIPEF